MPRPSMPSGTKQGETEKGTSAAGGRVEGRERKRRPGRERSGKLERRKPARLRDESSVGVTRGRFRETIAAVLPDLQGPRNCSSRRPQDENVVLAQGLLFLAA